MSRRNANHNGRKPAAPQQYVNILAALEVERRTFGFKSKLEGDFEMVKAILAAAIFWSFAASSERPCVMGNITRIVEGQQMGESRNAVLPGEAVRFPRQGTLQQNALTRNLAHRYEMGPLKPMCEGVA